VYYSKWRYINRLLSFFQDIQQQQLAASIIYTYFVWSHSRNFQPFGRRSRSKGNLLTAEIYVTKKSAPRPLVYVYLLLFES